MEINKTIDIGDVTFEINFNYYPASRGAREGGLQLEPDEPAMAEINEISLAGNDVTELLDDKIIEKIEEKLLDE